MNSKFLHIIILGLLGWACTEDINTESSLYGTPKLKKPFQYSFVDTYPIRFEWAAFSNKAEEKYFLHLVSHKNKQNPNVVTLTQFDFDTIIEVRGSNIYDWNSPKFGTYYTWYVESVPVDLSIQKSYRSTSQIFNTGNFRPKPFKITLPLNASIHHKKDLSPLIIKWSDANTSNQTLFYDILITNLSNSEFPLQRTPVQQAKQYIFRDYQHGDRYNIDIVSYNSIDPILTTKSPSISIKIRDTIAEFEKIHPSGIIQDWKTLKFRWHTPISSTPSKLRYDLTITELKSIDDLDSDILTITQQDLTDTVIPALNMIYDSFFTWQITAYMADDPTVFRSSKLDTFSIGSLNNLEISILKDIYRSLSGDTWNNQCKWDTTISTPNLYHGVSIDPIDKSISSINLSGCSLNGKIPNSLSQLRYIKKNQSFQ